MAPKKGLAFGMRETPECESIQGSLKEFEQQVKEITNSIDSVVKDSNIDYGHITANEVKFNNEVGSGNITLHNVGKIYYSPSVTGLDGYYPIDGNLAFANKRPYVFYNGKWRDALAPFENKNSYVEECDVHNKGNCCIAMNQFEAGKDEVLDDIDSYITQRMESGDPINAGCINVEQRSYNHTKVILNDCVYHFTSFERAEDARSKVFMNLDSDVLVTADGRAYIWDTKEEKFVDYF